MCRTGGRRCDRRWDDAHRERYNARRRITRNSEKAEAARNVDNEGKASYYDGLVASARATDDELTAAITAHEDDSHQPAAPVEHVDPEDYRISHSAPSNNGYNKPLDNPVGIYPDDYADHPDWYGAEHEETIRQVRAAQGDPDHVVTVYRGVPRGVTRISRGDWVALSHDYAEQEAMGDAEDGSEDGDVISARVPASTLFGEGSLEEWGYDGQQDIDTNDPPDPDALGVTPAPDEDDEASDSGGEQRCPDCGQFAGPGHVCAGASADADGAGGHPLADSPAEPTDFAFIRNPESLAGNQAADHDFGQDVEPSGRYLVEGTAGMDPPPGWESGTVRFERPLRMHWGESGLYTSEDNWKHRLSGHYGGKTGQDLSQAVRDDGFDAIITHDKYGVSETVDLTHLSPGPASGGSSSDTGGREKCGSCGQWAGSDHTCPQQAVKDQLRETSSSWRESFTQEEAQALDSFASIDHADINRKLRNGDTLTADEEATVKGLDSLTSRAPRTEEPHTLYRGIGFAEDARGESSGKDWVTAHCQEGQEVEFAGFTSTSTSRESAEYFSGARSEHVTSGVVFEVETTQAGYTRDSAEDEVLLGRGSRFEVVSASGEVDVEGKPYQQVRLREVEPSTPAATPAAGWDRGTVHGPREASEFGDHLESKHGVTMRLHGGSRDDSYVTLSHIEVPKEQRGSGVGKAAMRELVEEADRNGWKLDLTPAGDYGGSVPKLKRFYKAFGFVENKGRNKDYATRETFLRPPQ